MLTPSVPARSPCLKVKISGLRSLKVLLGFTLSDLTGEAFTYKQGERAGTLGVSMKARLLRIVWAKVDGQPFYSESEQAA